MNVKGPAQVVAALILACCTQLTHAQACSFQEAELKTTPDAIKALMCLQQRLEAAEKRVADSAGKVGPQGPQGLTGPQGPIGPAGPSMTRNSLGKVVISHESSSAGGGYSSWLNESGKQVAFLGSASTTNQGLLVLWDKEGSNRGIELVGDGRIMLNGKSIGDFAEVFEFSSRDGITPGSVVAVQTPQGALGPSAAAYDHRVVGVVAGAGALKSGLVMGARIDGTADLPIAISGQVYVRASLEGGAIGPGDLLVASTTPGVAMKSTNTDRSTGAVIGKALEALELKDQTEGLVRILVMLR
jgi:hypothetical protein